MQLPKYSIGLGDRFAHQAKAQLHACILAAEAGIEITPVWNKSNREHNIVGSDPSDTRAAADAAVKALGWRKAYFVDADHINLQTMQRFIQPCDFFTIDVADLIGKPAAGASVEAFCAKHRELAGTLRIPHVNHSVMTDLEFVTHVAGKYLAAIQEAGRIFRRIEELKGQDNFIAEISMDETDSPQTPAELLMILAAIADEGVAIQTIAPKFTGRFNKGVDYVGDLSKFAEEFSDDIAVIAFAVQKYGLPRNLKLSVHSGSDKFSIYEPIGSAIKKFDAGVHLKTAGTTWLEELIGLAESGGAGLELAKEIYRDAWCHREELCVPYASVIDIDSSALPGPELVETWSPESFVSAIRHDQHNSAYNSSMRQLLHVAFKVAAKMGQRYIDLLRANESIIAINVTHNLLERHIKPMFPTQTFTCSSLGSSR
jgi:tagaturonate epimerase